MCDIKAIGFFSKAIGFCHSYPPKVILFIQKLKDEKKKKGTSHTQKNTNGYPFNKRKRAIRD